MRPELSETQEFRLKAYHEQFGEICNKIAWLEKLYADCISEGISAEMLILKSPCGKIVNLNQDSSSVEAEIIIDLAPTC